MNGVLESYDLNRPTIQIVAIGIVLILGTAAITYQFGSNDTWNLLSDYTQNSPRVIIKEIPVVVEKEIPIVVVKEVPVQRVEIVYLKQIVEIPSPGTRIQVDDSPKNPSTNLKNDVPVVFNPEKLSPVPNKTKNIPAPIKPTANDEQLRGGFRIGGHARFLDSLTGLIDVDDLGVVKTINVHILQDSDARYFFDPDSLTVPAGKLVKFVVHNTHFTPDECW